jgi:DNA-directed RNA polymerase subunit RPC12/RpoP
MRNDPMETIHCCLQCHWRGPFKKLIGADVVRCPQCDSDRLRNCRTMNVLPVKSQKVTD